MSVVNEHLGFFSFRGENGDPFTCCKHDIIGMTTFRQPRGLFDPIGTPKIMLHISGVDKVIVDQATYDEIARRLEWPPHPPPRESGGA